MFLVKSKKSPYYQIIYFLDGKRKSKSTGVTKKGEALQFLSNLKENLIKKEELKRISLQGYKEEYLHFIELSFSKKYYCLCKNSLNILNREIGDLQLDLINIYQAEKFILEIFKRTKHGASLHFRVLKTAFKKAKEWKYIHENPFDKIKLPKIDKPLPSFINQEQFELLLKQINKQDLRDIYSLLFHTGLRVSEALNLNWEDIDFKEKTLKVCNKIDFTTKNKKERSIPLNDTIYRMLLSRINSQKIFTIKKNYVFTKLVDIKYSPEYVSKSFKKAIRKAQLNERIHLHSLRHSFCSNLVSKGVSLYIVKELAGHENITTTQIYSHLQSETLRDAVNLLG